MEKVLISYYVNTSTLAQEGLADLVVSLIPYHMAVFNSDPSVFFTDVREDFWGSPRLHQIDRILSGSGCCRVDVYYIVSNIEGIDEFVTNFLANIFLVEKGFLCMSDNIENRKSGEGDVKDKTDLTLGTSLWNIYSTKKVEIENREDTIAQKIADRFISFCSTELNNAIQNLVPSIELGIPKELLKNILACEKVHKWASLQDIGIGKGNSSDRILLTCDPSMLAYCCPGVLAGMSKEFLEKEKLEEEELGRVCEGVLG